MPDIAEQLDAAIGVAPRPAPPLDRTLAEGRRALGRRRLAYAVGAVATTVVIGGTAWAVAPGDGSPSRSDTPGFTAPRTATPSSPPATRGQHSGITPLLQWPGEDAARLGRSGELEVRPGWTLTDRRDAINGPHTLAVEVSRGKHLQWYLFGTSMTISSLHAPSEGYATFQEWLDVNGPLIEGTPPGNEGHADASDWPGEPRDDLVFFAPRFMDAAHGLLPASGDVVVVHQLYAPDLGASFAPPARSGIAEVRKDGETFYVVARRPADYIAVQADVARNRYGVTDLASFLAFAQERYAEGGGGLL